MNTSFYLFDIFKYTLSGLIVFFTGFYVVRTYYDRIKMIGMLELKKTTIAHTLPLRLQAYERMILFIERINPANLLLRIHVSEINASEMHQMIISEIRSEFQHNIAQQLYISNQAWMIVKRLKEDTIALINNAAKSLPDNTSSLELNKAILTHLSNLDENPYDTALSIIKQDIQTLF
jgi:hypothetical protein